MAHPVIEKWLNNAVGRKLNYDHAYGLQCVDAVDAFAEDIFGVPWEISVGGVAGAKDLLDVAPDEYWIRIDNNPNSPNLLPQRGDVLVWGGRAGVNPWGHTAICLSSDANGVTVIQQDGFAEPLQFVNNNWYSAKPTHTARLGWDNYGTGMISGWLRAKENKLPKVTTQSIPPVKAIGTVKPEQLEELKEWLGTVLVGEGYSLGRGKNKVVYPSLAQVDIENQRRASKQDEKIEELETKLDRILTILESK